MGEVTQSLDLEIEWDVPLPPRPIVFAQAHKGPLWTKRLNPLRQWPGRRARIYQRLTQKQARTKTTNIVRSLRQSDPYEDWKIESRRDDFGVYGIWATYNGVMTEAEYVRRAHERSVQAAKAQNTRLLNSAKAAQALGRSRLNATLRPPTVD